MLEKISAVLRRKPLLGVGISVVIHAGLLAALLWVHPARTPMQKRGDALIVELPNLQEPASRGTPGPSLDEPASPAAPKASPTPPSPPPARPTPPRPSVAARPTPAPREAPRAVASVPKPRSAPSEIGDTPTTKATPQPPAETAKPAPEAAQPEPLVASAPPSQPGQVAMVPPSPPDIRSLRRAPGGGGAGSGGADGTGQGRGGFQGEPIPIETKDSNYTDYFSRIKPMIQRAWIFPCAAGMPTAQDCRRRDGIVLVEFGIAKSGRLEHIELRGSAGSENMDAAALNALKLASPYPPVPASLVKGTGVLILVAFRYIVQDDLVNIRIR